MNPFFSPFNTVHKTIPFEIISTSDIEEAIRTGIVEQDKEINLIISCVDDATFSNTIDTFERSGSLLDQSTSVLFNLISAETNDELDALSERITPILSNHTNNIYQNKKLFARIKSVYDHYHSNNTLQQSLSPEQRTLLNEIYETFVRTGANLDESQKTHFNKLSQELSLLELKFAQNLLKDINNYKLEITDKDDLKGLPTSVLDAAKAESESRNHNGWTFTLHAPCYVPFMTYCSNRSLRRQLYMAYNTLCTHNNANNNISIIKEIINKRHQLAQILGYNCYADYILIKRMAEKKENVTKLLHNLYQYYMPVAQKEVESVKAIAHELEGPSFELMPWDFSYYSNKLKERMFNFNSEMIRPYLELERVKEGVFGLASDLYGLKFTRNTAIQVYHKDVEAYEVFDKHGNYQAVLYCDFFPRSTKKSGAWMTSFREQWKEKDGKVIRPHVSIVTNFTKPTSTKPSLLTFSELETFLHEFGHALHGILSDTTYKSLNGTNVYWDFVELPSQLMENYAYERDFLSRFSYHYETGDPIPDDLIDKIIQSRNFNVAYSCIRQVSFGELDMYYHSISNSFNEDIIKIEKIIFDRTRLLPNIDGTCMSAQFSHIMSGGYSAGYYSYKWAEVLESDAFSLFKEFGIFDSNIASRFKECILSRGGTEHPMILYKRFRGKEPTINALLSRNGINK